MENDALTIVDVLQLQVRVPVDTGATVPDVLGSTSPVKEALVSDLYVRKSVRNACIIATDAKIDAPRPCDSYLET